jgi:tetratricopeptide (TPR) repeat protein
MISGILTNLISELISGTGQFLFGDLTDNVKWKAWKAKHQLSKNQNDFLDRYAETLILFKKADKADALIKFYGRDIVINTVYDYWYDKTDRVAFEDRVREFVRWFRIEETLEGFSAEREIAYFLESFAETVNDNRTAGETEVFQLIARIGQQLSKNETPNFPKYLTQLPVMEDELVGREDMILELRSRLEQSQRIVLVNGIGGVGKTATAMTYANRFKDEYKHVIWLEKSSNFVGDTISNKLLLQNLDFTIKGDDSTADNVKAILNKIENLDGPGLLVIDNADRDLLVIRDFLPRPPKWHVILTSREELGIGKKIPLDFLSEKDAMQLFYNHYKWERNDKQVKQIIHLVDYHTLTIEILAKMAQSRRIKRLNELIKLLEEKGLEIGRKVNRATGHSKNEEVEFLFPYLQAIFRLNPNWTGDQLELLKIFVALPPIFVPLDMFFQLFGVGPEESYKQDLITIALEKLRVSGWLSYNEELDAYKMHRIVQDVLLRREEVKLSFLELRGLEQRICNALAIDDQWKDNPVDKFPFVPYAERILHLVSNEPGGTSFLLNSKLATVYGALGRYEEAAQLLEKQLESSLKSLGETHPNIAARQADLAQAYGALGRYEEALSLSEKALAMGLARFGEGDPKVADYQSALAAIYQILGRYKEALDLFKKVLASNLKSYGEGHPKVLKSQSNLATSYETLGRYEEAADLLEKVLASELENSPHVASYQLNLAVVYKSLGRFKEAAHLMEQALESNLANYGERHPEVTNSQSNLAIIYSNLHRYGEASRLLQKALASSLAIYGESHRRVAICQSNLAGVYRDLGNVAEAKSLWEKARQTFKENLGEDHPHTKTVQRFLDELDGG